MPGFAPYEPYRRGWSEPVSAVIRNVTPDDLDARTAIELAAVTRTRDDWATALDKALNDDDRLRLVVDVEGRVAAFGQAHFLPRHPAEEAPPGFYLTGMTVLPAYRRRGLGRRLAAARLEWVRERADAAWYFASSANKSSIDLHRTFGFSDFGRV